MNKAISFNLVFLFKVSDSYIIDWVHFEQTSNVRKWVLKLRSTTEHDWHLLSSVMQNFSRHYCLSFDSHTQHFYTQGCRRFRVLEKKQLITTANQDLRLVCFICTGQKDWIWLWHPSFSRLVQSTASYPEVVVNIYISGQLTSIHLITIIKIITCYLYCS